MTLGTENRIILYKYKGSGKMTQKIKAKIICTIDKTHPDINCVDDWTENKKFEFEDIYIFPSHCCIDYIMQFIKNDLRLVMGGGYDWKHIHNEKFEIERIN